MLLYIQREKTDLAILSACNSLIGVTLLWKICMTVIQLWKQGIPFWSIGSGENTLSSFALCIYNSTPSYPL